ncbi:MAG: helix-turn-helix transcriptional regulator [Coriobacteriales bacterium]|nr:helix-turn-helix transcriptional regulator [Coriobacteriales bacterium]
MDRPLFSDMLSERRRELGYSIRQTSRVLRLKEEVLIAFEEGDFEQMPKPGYAQGMLSSYARYLGLDAREVVRAYTQDLEDYTHSSRRQKRGAGGKGSGGADNARVGQPYVAKRGLLPTSGGFAGDMGSFATTRVHTRAPEPGADAYEGYDGYSDASQDERYAPSRPYTGRTPSRQSRNRRTSARSDIRTMDLDEYNDDLGFGRDAQPYESATTSRGRRSSRNLGNTQRPRVNRRSRDGAGSRGSQGRGDRRGSRNGRSSSQSSGLSVTPAFALVAVVLIIVITVILVVSVGSCVRQNSDLSHSVPVSAKSTESSASGSAANSAASSTAAATTTGSASGSSAHASATGSTTGSGKAGAASSASKSQDTSVSISVADGAVTWLEVTVDGKSDVAQTVTGPWQRTYTVEKTLSVQAGDTTAVSVVQNGRQMQFESMASGIGTLVIEGSGKSSTSASGTNSTTSTTTSTGNAAGTAKSDTAKTGNNSMVSKDEDSNTKTNDYGESYSEYDDSTYYDEYGNAY